VSASDLSSAKHADRLSVGLSTRVLRGAVRGLDASVSVVLNLIVTKPIAMFVWWLHARANRTTFHDRAELAARVRQARRAGRPVLFASNHVSMFDDPVVPMALFRTGPRAAAEFACLAVLGGVCWISNPVFLPPPLIGAAWLACLAGISVLGARKTWWSIGDLVNFSGSSALRAKLEFGRQRPLSIPLRLLLAVADPVVFFFMRSATVKTVLVDRRSGEEARQSRARAVEKGIELAAAGEQIWLFFEGGRSREPEQIRPARGGIGQLVKGLQGRAVRPLVIAVHHRGLEQVMPLSSRRWLTSGHRIDIRWSELDLAEAGDHAGSDRGSQRIADEIRAAVVELQAAWLSERSTHA
jgi:1-acyl-sn-glycerol-3-phosphate acyltransferase